MNRQEMAERVELLTKMAEQTGIEWEADDSTTPVTYRYERDPDRKDGVVKINARVRYNCGLRGFEGTVEVGDDFNSVIMAGSELQCVARVHEEMIEQLDRLAKEARQVHDELRQAFCAPEQGGDDE